MRTITLTLTFESKMTDEQVVRELLQRYGSLKYVWNNCRTDYGPSGVEITDVTVGVGE